VKQRRDRPAASREEDALSSEGEEEPDHGNIPTAVL